MMSDQIDQLKTIVRLRKRDLERCAHEVAAARQAIAAAQAQEEQAAAAAKAEQAAREKLAAASARAGRLEALVAHLPQKAASAA